MIDSGFVQAAVGLLVGLGAGAFSVVAVGFRDGRWRGHVDARLDALGVSVERLERRIERFLDV